MKKLINCRENNRLSPARPAGGLKLAWLGVLAAALLAAGCLSSGPAGRKNMLESSQALEMARRIYAEGQRVKTLAAKGSFRYQEKNRQHFVRFDLAAKRPNQLLFTAYDPAGRPALRLFVDGETLTAIDYLSREVISGRATSRNLMAFLPLGLNPDQMIIALAGGQPLDQPVKASSGDLGRQPSSTPLALDVWSPGDTDDDHWRYRLADGREPEVISAQYGPRRKPHLAFQYQNYKTVFQGPGARKFPHLITLRAGQGDASREITIRYDQVALDEDLSATLFSPPMVEGFKRVDLLDVLGPAGI